MIVWSHGDLLTADAEALVNAVNTVGVMGKGIALQFKHAHPANYAAYRAACAAGDVRLGRMFVVDSGRAGHHRYVINFPTKGHWRAGAKLPDIRSGLSDLARVVRERQIRSVAVPALGCGAGGLDWAVVEPMIVEAFAELPDVRVLVFPPDGVPPSYRHLLPVAERAVAQAAELMRHRAPGALTAKGERDFASQLDYEIEREVRAFLRDATPEIGFLGEEDGVQGTGDMQWVLDPIDGTVNFVRGLPLCAVSLGLLHADEAVLGVIEAPFLGNRYAAARGNGATVDGKPIRVSGTTRLSDAIVAIGDYAVGADAAARNQPRLALTARLAEAVQRVRMVGSAALDLAWLAEGRIDATLTLCNYPWDMTGGTAIAREAGAVVVDHDGSAHHPGSSVTLGITPGLTEQVLSLVGEALREG